MSDGVATALDATHLASEAIVSEVKTKVREHGLVIWLDAEGHYGSLVDALASGAFGFSYPVVALRGSYLELMLALEPYGNEQHRDHLLIHLPGLNRDTVKETPIYELAAAGHTHERNLAKAIRQAAIGVARPEEIDAFLRAPDLTLAHADSWLAEQSEAPRDGLSALLDGLGIDDVVLALVAGDRRIAAYLPDHAEKLLSFLEKGIGLDATWRRYRLGDAKVGPEAAATLVASYLMAVEFVHDLRDEPVTAELRALKKLASPLAKASRKLAALVRDRLPDHYEELENDLQRVLVEERTSHHAEALGSIDTFRFEEAATRAAALDALRGDQWDRAYAYAVDRTPESCFWVKRAPALQRTWELIRLASEAGRAFAGSRGLSGCASLEEATTRYAEKLAAIDRAHRIFEQRAHALLASDLSDHDALLEARAAVRRAHRTWSDDVNRAFSELCRAHGALPGRSLRQRAVYEDVVQRKIDEGGRVAFFMVDALRFEMAQELAKQLEREKFRVRLDARLAELPTETHVGMNALAPVEDAGVLRAIVENGDLLGFRRKEFAVRTPAARVRAIVERSMRGSAAVDLELESFADLGLIALRRKLAVGGPVVVVRSRELDTAGEHRLHLGTFDQTLVLLKSAVSLLSQAGVTRFVIAADHGFLLQDSTVENAQFGATKRSATRRYGILEEPSGKSDVFEVRLSALEYETPKDLYLVFAPDTRVWKTQDEVAPYVHGGNSLQERVIPVLEVERAAPRGKTMSKYEVVASPEPAHLGRQRLRVSVRLQQSESAPLAFEGPRTISLALRVHPTREDVVLTVIAADPPAELAGGRVLVPPNRSESIVEFEIEGTIDERVRVEVYHPDAVAEVAPKVVEGFFDVARDRRLPKPETPKPPPVEKAASTGGWEELVIDDAYRRVLKIVEERRSINEEELLHVLGTPMRVRAFARNFDKLVVLLPFAIEVLTVNSMKVYARKD